MEKNYKLSGRTYSFGFIPGRQALKVMITVTKMIGEPLFKVLVTEKSEKGDTGKKATFAETGSVVMGLLMGKLDSDELLATMEVVFAHAACDGQRIDIDATFTGRPKDMLMVFLAGLRFNFQDFFPDALLASIQSKAGEALSSLNQQT